MDQTSVFGWILNVSGAECRPTSYGKPLEAIAATLFHALLSALRDSQSHILDPRRVFLTV